MKEIKTYEIRKMCWKRQNDVDTKCAVGFLVEETDTQVHIASTKNIDGFSDSVAIPKNEIVSCVAVGEEKGVFKK